MTKEQQEDLNEILDDAKRCSNKGRLYVYEDYKQQIVRLNLNYREFDEACRKLSNYLRV